VFYSSGEQIPALKSHALLHQSPRRKQPQGPEGAFILSLGTTVASISSLQSTLPPVMATAQDKSAGEIKV